MTSTSGNDSPSGHGGSRSRPLAVGRGIPFAWRWLILLTVTGLVVQLSLPFRHDQPAHLVAGGALVLFVTAAISPERFQRFEPVLDLWIFSVVLGVSCVTEATVLGPFDIVDISFTLAGAFVALAGVPELVRMSATTRRSTAWMCIGLAAGALAYRYVLGIGAR